MQHAYKALVAILGAVLMALVASYTDDTITLGEWVLVAIAGFGAWQVYASANLAGATIWRYTKGLTAGMIAALTLLVSYIEGDGEITNQMWLLVAVAGLTAAGVIAVPNGPAVVEVQEVPPR